MKEAVSTVEYLQYKWGLYFDIVDINGDNILDTTDVELSKAHYRRHNNLSTREVRGRPFDHEGRAWQIWSGQIIYFHHVLGRKIYFRVNRGKNIYFQPQQFFEKENKWGGGSVRGLNRGDKIWLSMFCITLCRLLAHNTAYLVSEIF